jgi:hypothetical protein
MPQKVAGGQELSRYTAGVPAVIELPQGDARDPWRQGEWTVYQLLGAHRNQPPPTVMRETDVAMLQTTVAVK